MKLTTREFQSVIVSILLIITCFTFPSCNDNSNEPNEDFYYDYECVLVWKHMDSEGKIFLIQSVEDPELYREISSQDVGVSGGDMYCSCNRIDLSDANFYSKKVDDVLHFDYIRKDKFWRSEDLDLDQFTKYKR